MNREQILFVQTTKKRLDDLEKNVGDLKNLESFIAKVEAEISLANAQLQNEVANHFDNILKEYMRSFHLNMRMNTDALLVRIEEKLDKFRKEIMEMIARADVSDMTTGA